MEILSIQEMSFKGSMIKNIYCKEESQNYVLYMNMRLK